MYQTTYATRSAAQTLGVPLAITPLLGGRQGDSRGAEGSCLVASVRFGNQAAEFLRIIRRASGGGILATGNLEQVLFYSYSVS
jgi:hypothetical protein